MQLTISIIDAFTQHVFAGNQAAVIITDDWLDDDKMQSIAAENNLSETAFCRKLADDNYLIRWFSPITEIDFCGHATLASAFVVFSQYESLGEITFSAEAVGALKVNKLSDGAIQMRFPNRKPEIINDIPEELLTGVSITPREILRNEQAYVLVYDNEADVLSISTKNNELAKLAPYDVVVTAPSSSYDFVSRYFWPANGGDEDPVTGSIHAGLAPFWSERLAKSELLAFQASKRGGELSCKVSGEFVYISGYAVKYLTGEITV